MQAESVDSCVTDPPYELGFMGKDWDKKGIAFKRETWTAIHRVLKPGARLLAFGGSRTHHRIWCAIEDAGFVLEDTIMWLYGSGFPKHRSKLKPAYEPICVARKGPVSDLNIDAARIGLGGQLKWERPRDMGYHGGTDAGSVRAMESTLGRWPANVVLDEEAAALLDEQSGILAGGNHPAYRAGIGYGSGAKGTNGTAVRLDAGGASRFYYTSKATRTERNGGLEGQPLRNGGSNAAGFTADVANGSDRNRPVANHHPTVKPLDLMRWLVRLVTPTGGNVLDPFMGSGTTGVAAVHEGFGFIGIEMNHDYVEIARRRILNAPLSLGLGA